ncbi:MAG: VCBS repeat-containing protein [Polyangiaceae bacterium]
MKRLHALAWLGCVSLGCGGGGKSDDGGVGGSSANSGGVTATGGGSSTSSGGAKSSGGSATTSGGSATTSGGALATAGGSSATAGGSTAQGGAVTEPSASCAKAATSSATVAKPELQATLFDRYQEAWLGSPAIADLDADGVNEIIVPRDELLVIWHPDGSVVRKFTLPGRIWAPPVVADLVPSLPGLEVAVAARQQIGAWDATGKALPGFPITYKDEMRALAAEDLDKDGKPELVAVTTSDLKANGQTDIIIAYRSDGSVMPGFPPNTTGKSGCDTHCYVHAGFDQTLALGDVDNDGLSDILVPQDNSYVSLHHGDGVAFAANALFKTTAKFMGVRFILDYTLAQQGYADDEDTATQAHFTNTAPAIVDVDGDGTNELVMLSSVQNVAQTDRQRGVALWVVRHDGTRPDAWVAPFHVPAFIDGLEDPGANIVGATNQVTPVDLDPSAVGFEFVFAGFDGKIHAVTSDKRELWTYSFTSQAGVLTGGVVAADLSGDGVPELVFNTYSSAANGGALFVLSAAGKLLHQIALPDRGAMPVPSIADVDGDGDLEVVVSLKDAVDKMRQVFVYTVPGSSTNCLPWPTGRGNLRRTGFIAAAAK